MKYLQKMPYFIDNRVDDNYSHFSRIYKYLRVSQSFIGLLSINIIIISKTENEKAENEV